jgi:hypothetical protein
VNLGELALTCFAYGAMNTDDSLGQFSRRVEGNADLFNEEHRLALLHWLNQWQCRQFSLAYHDLASVGLLEWHIEFGEYLPPKATHLWEIPEATVEDYARVFDSLARKLASFRQTGPGKKSAVSFGPTAAAKILFVLRPRVFVAWDEPLRATLHYDGSGHSYAAFLLRLREELLDLQDQCRSFALDLTDLPEAVGRPLSTPAQLMDEYYWATVTHGVEAPSRGQVARWLEWYTPADRQPTLVLRDGLGGGSRGASGRQAGRPGSVSPGAASPALVPPPAPGPDVEPGPEVDSEADTRIMRGGG